MSEFKRYIERRQRTGAFQFMDIAEVEFVGGLLRASKWVVHGNHDSFSVDFAIERLGREATEVSMNRGDYLMRPDHWSTVEVVPFADFRESWEEEK